MAKKRSGVISVLITGDSSGLNKALDDTTSKLATFGKVAAGALAGAGVAFAAFAKGGLEAAIATEAAQERLATLLRNTGLASEEQIKGLNAQAAALEQVGVAAGSNITVLQSQLATFDLSAQAIEKLTPAIVDYVIAEKGAAATADDFQAAANGLAQALQGNFGALSRVGFVLDDTTKDMIKNGTEAQRAAALVDVLSSTYGGFNEKARETAVGGLQALRNQFGAIQEAIGAALLPILHRFIDWFEANGPKIQAFGERFVAGFVAAIDRAGEIFVMLRTKFDEVVDFIRWRLGDFRRYIRHNLQRPVDEVQKRIGEFVDTVKRRFSEFKDAIPAAVKGLKDFFAEVRALSDDPEALGERLGSALAAAVYNALRTLRDQSTELYETLKEMIARVDWGGMGRSASTYMLQFAVGFAAGLISMDWLGPVLRVLADNWQAVVIGALSIAFSGPAIIGKLAGILAKIPIVGRLLSWFVTTLNNVFKPVRDGIALRAGLVFQSFSNAFLTALRGGGPGIVQSFVNFMLFIPRALIRAFDDMIVNVAIGFSRFGTALGTGIRTFAAKAAEFLSFLLTPFRAFGKMLIDDLFMLGKNIVSALINGMRSMIGALSNVVRAIGRTVWDDLSRLWRISSPSKVFMDMGRQVGIGLALGIESTERMIRDAALVAGGAASVDTMIGGMRGGGGSAGSTINVTVTSADPQAVVDAIRRYTRQNGPLGQVVAV